MSKIGEKFPSKHFLAVVCPSPVNRTRLGVTVTKKVGNAVTRNRIKRFSREYFRVNRHSAKGYWDINIIAKKSCADITFSQASSCLENIFERISKRDY